MCTECLEPSRLVSITLIFVIVLFYFLKSLPGRSDSKESACNAGDLGLIPGLGRLRAWQPTPVFLPGESPRTEEPDGLQSIGSQRVGHD